MTLSMQVRPGRREDLDAIVALDRETEFAPHWPVASYAAIVGAIGCSSSSDTPSRCLFVAEQFPADKANTQPRLVGFAIGLVHPAVDAVTEPRLAELEDVVVSARCRRSGVGRALCSAVLGWYRSQGATEAVLEVRAANTAAIGLYLQLGFEGRDRRRGYYSDPKDDAVLMRLEWHTAAKESTGIKPDPSATTS